MKKKEEEEEEEEDEIDSKVNKYLDNKELGKIERIKRRKQQKKLSK